MMNNKTFVEASRCLAERMLEHDPSPREAIAHGFQLLTARRPNDHEANLLIEAYEEFMRAYVDDTRAAKKLTSVGEKPNGSSLDVSQHAAMTMVASLILNLDETVTKE